jgi:hypothetical protein
MRIPHPFAGRVTTKQDTNEFWEFPFAFHIFLIERKLPYKLSSFMPIGDFTALVAELKQNPDEKKNSYILLRVPNASNSQSHRHRM